jgi:hypothetical protein
MDRRRERRLLRGSGATLFKTSDAIVQVALALLRLF